MLLYENGLQTSVMHVVPIVGVIMEVVMTSIVSQSRTIINSTHWYPLQMILCLYLQIQIINVPNFCRWTLKFLLIDHICGFLMYACIVYIASFNRVLCLSENSELHNVSGHEFSSFIVFYIITKNSLTIAISEFRKADENSKKFCSV